MDGERGRRFAGPFRVFVRAGTALEIPCAGKHFRYSFVAVLACMLAFGFILWLNGE